MVKGPWGPPEIHLEFTLLHNFQRGRWMGSIKCSQDWGAAAVWQGSRRKRALKRKISLLPRDPGRHANSEPSPQEVEESHVER